MTTMTTFRANLIHEMVETVLAMFPANPYQVIFAVHERREELVTYVMNRIVKHSGLSDTPNSTLREFFATADSRLRLQSLVCEGIHHVAEQYPQLDEDALT